MRLVDHQNSRVLCGGGQSCGLGRELDSFIDLGAYNICAVTQRLSVYFSILLLMTQALVSRILAPGISNKFIALLRCCTLFRWCY
jgi:hypothetical protein